LINTQIAKRYVWSYTNLIVIKLRMIRVRMHPKIGLNGRQSVREASTIFMVPLNIAPREPINVKAWSEMPPLYPICLKEFPM
jgi:hypothetical protein